MIISLRHAQGADRWLSACPEPVKDVEADEWVVGTLVWVDAGLGGRHPPLQRNAWRRGAWRTPFTAVGYPMGRVDAIHPNRGMYGGGAHGIRPSTGSGSGAGTKKGREQISCFPAFLISSY